MQVATDDIRAALGRVAGSRLFKASQPLTAFLRYVVERWLAGETSRLKGYTIAVEALGRPASFDPRIDPIVRVAAGRLRRRLARYYAGEGAADPLLIELQKGRYIPVFRWRGPREPPPGDAGGCADPDLGAALRQIIQVCRLQMQTMAAEIETAERILAHACPSGTRLLPTAPSSRNAIASTADGRQERKIEQAQGAVAARPRRSRARRNRRDAADDRGDPHGL